MEWSSQFDQHDDGDIGLEHCGSCFWNYTTKCKCGGRIHNEFFDEGWSDVILTYWCDQCGDNQEVFKPAPTEQTPDRSCHEPEPRPESHS